MYPDQVPLGGFLKIKIHFGKEKISVETFFLWKGAAAQSVERSSLAYTKDLRFKHSLFLLFTLH